MNNESKIVEIFTDGACRGNPGPGGWGVLLRYERKERQLLGAELETTNNRMELTAAIEGLSVLKRVCSIKLTTDSEYLQKGITLWLPKWKRNQWKTSNKKPVKNADLWQRLDKLVVQHQVSWHWVRGHSGHAENDLVDKLANQAIDELLARRK